jgi:F-type H+-transporting ATPase subunit b
LCARGSSAPQGSHVIPDLSVLWVIFFVLLLTLILNQLLFKPIVRVINAREGAVRDARALADSASQQAGDALREFENRTRAARAEVHQQMEATRRAAEVQRAQIVAAARQQSETTLADAHERLEQETAAARARIEHDADAIASSIAQRILGRQTS